jgi:starvation-inducible DNA-binding protein
MEPHSPLERMTTYNNFNQVYRYANKARRSKLKINMEPHIGIKPENRAEVVQVLSQLLADEIVLLIKTRKAHWNIESPDFYYMHKFFEDQYSQIDELVDDVAERMRTLGHYAPATLQQFLQLTHLSEHPEAQNDSHAYLKELLAAHESIVVNIRKHIHPVDTELQDSGTSDFLTGIMKSHEKNAWMLRSHLK